MEQKIVLNIFQKLAKARAELNALNLKKSGKNTFANYEYFELDDILPSITKLEDKYQILSIINFTPEVATLIMVNSENPNETLQFQCEMKASDIKGGSPIQQYGGSITYSRRYLLLNAWNISEVDAGEITFNPNDKKEEPKKNAKAPKQEPEQQPIKVNQTIEEIDIQTALDCKTTKGTRYEELSDDKLQWIIDNSKSDFSKQCAKLVIEYHKQELEEIANRVDELIETDIEAPF